MEYDIRYKEFVEKVKGVELSRLPRQGTSTQAPTTNAPPAPRAQVFKPIDVFLDQHKKATP